MVKLAWADQIYAGANAQQAAQTHGIELHIIKLAEAKKLLRVIAQALDR